jgi:hypothetical protein
MRVSVVGLQVVQRTDARAPAPQRRRMHFCRCLAMSAALLPVLLIPQTILAQQHTQQQRSAPQSQWTKFPRMQLLRQFAGPLQDTIVQVWRDPTDGVLCYIYLPIIVQHSPPVHSGYVEYGANAFGSISCLSLAHKTTPAKRPLILHH